MFARLKGSQLTGNIQYYISPGVLAEAPTSYEYFVLCIATFIANLHLSRFGLLVFKHNPSIVLFSALAEKINQRQAFDPIKLCIT